MTDDLADWLAALGQLELGEPVRVVWRSDEGPPMGAVSWVGGNGWRVELAQGQSDDELLITMFHELGHVVLGHVTRGAGESGRVRLWDGLARVDPAYVRRLAAEREAAAEAWARQRVACLGPMTLAVTRALAGEVA